jgi:hypothetical protein
MPFGPMSLKYGEHAMPRKLSIRQSLTFALIAGVLARRTSYPRR